MRRGFTLVEVVVAIVLLEVCVLGVAGLLTLSARTLARAEELEAAVGVAEGVLDSLRRVPFAVPGSRAVDGGTLDWTVEAGVVSIRAAGDDGARWFTLSARSPAP